MKRLRNNKGIAEVIIIGWAATAILCAIAYIKPTVPVSERNNADRWYEAEIYRP